MKRKLLLISFLIATALLFSGAVSAYGDIAYNVVTEVNGVELSSWTTMAGAVGDTVPVRVSFVSNANLSDVRVKVHMEGYRDEISASTDRFDIVEGSVYSKLLALKLPSDEKSLTEEYTLYVEIVSKKDGVEKKYTIRMQRDSYTMKILSADYPSKVSAGDTFPVAIVVKNTGYDRLDDVYAVVSIPSLGISSRSYLGDLVPVESKCCEDEEDSLSKVVYVRLPKDAKKGVYEMVVEVYNDDARTSVKKLVSVGEAGTVSVLAGVKSKDLKIGESTTYDLTIVNSGDKVKVFNLDATSGSALDVSVPSVVTVGPESSKTVSIKVRALDEASVGTYTFTVDVNGNQMVFAANVIEGTNRNSASVVALVVVLAVVLVVLIVVLFVLLAGRKKSVEEVETSYY